MKILLQAILICWLFSINQFKAYSRYHNSVSTNTNSHIRVYPVTGQGKTSTDYTLTVNGIVVPIEKIEKYSDAPVQYALMDFDGSVKLNFELTARAVIQKYAISPKSKKIEGAVSGNKLKFSIGKAQYIVVRIQGLDDLFILIDTLNNSPPLPGSPSVKNITDYPGVDPTGHKNSSAAINKAIAESSLSNNHPVLYFPPGTYLSGEIKMKDNVTIYLAGGAVIQATDNIADHPQKWHIGIGIYLMLFPVDRNVSHKSILQLVYQQVCSGYLIQ